jgi:hypothetical protein
MRIMIPALLIGAILGAVAMAWLGGPPLPPGAEVRFVADPSWWPASAPRCPPLDTRALPPARSLSTVTTATGAVPSGAALFTDIPHLPAAERRIMRRVAA